MFNKGYKLLFCDFRYEITKGNLRSLVVDGIRTYENIYYLKENKGSCMMVQSSECRL